jgi:hypothetical protein
MSIQARARPYFPNHSDSEEDQFNVGAVLYWRRYGHVEILDCNLVCVAMKQADQWTKNIVSPFGFILLSSQTSWHLIKYIVGTLGTKTETPSCISGPARKYEKESLYTSRMSYHALRFLVHNELLYYSTKSAWKEVFRIYVVEHCLQGCDTG